MTGAKIPDAALAPSEDAGSKSPLAAEDSTAASDVLSQPADSEPAAAEGMSMEEFVEGVRSVFAELAAQQEPLDPEIYAIWQEHRENLYMS